MAKQPRVKRIDTGPDVARANARMEEMMELLLESRSPDPRVEYSALLCLASAVMASVNGLPPTYANHSKILRIVAEQLIPEIEAQVRRMLTN